MIDKNIDDDYQITHNNQKVNQMELSIPNPSLNFNATDQSAIDESISQGGPVTINASGNAQIHSNSGNGKAQKTSVTALFQVMAVSIICDILICAILAYANISTTDKMEQRAFQRFTQVKQQMESVVKNTDDAIEEIKKTTDKVVEDSKEGTIWILRRDILNSIELYESKKVITEKEYKRIKDQFDYYTKIGGNHDVHDRMDGFNNKILALGEIKMVH